MEKEKKPFYKKWWFWLIAILIIIGCSDTSDDEKDSSTNNSPKEEQADKPKKDEKEQKESSKAESKKEEEPKTPADKIKQEAKKAGMTSAEVEDKGNKIYVIKTNAPQTLANSQYKGAVPTEISDILKGTKDVDYNAIFFDFVQTLVDEKGNETESPGVLVLYTKDTVNSINLNNWPADPIMVYKASTAYAFDGYAWNKDLKYNTKEEIGSHANGVSELDDNLFTIFSELQGGK